MAELLNLQHRYVFIRSLTMLYLACLGLLVNWCPAAGWQAIVEKPPFNQIDTADAHIAYAIEELADGRIVTAGTHLVAYDGQNFEVLPRSHSGLLKDLKTDPQGRTWYCGGKHIGYLTSEGGHLRNHRLDAKLPTEIELSLWSLHHYGRDLWITGENHLLRYHKDNFQHWQLPGEQRLLAFPVGEQLYVLNRGDKLYRADVDGPKPVSNPFLMEQLGLGVIGKLPRQTHTLLITIDGKLFKAWHEEEMLRLEHIHNLAIPEEAIVYGTRWLDASHYLLHGSTGLSIFQVASPDPILHIDSQDGLSGDVVFDILLDAEGSVWATTYENVNRIEPPLKYQYFHYGDQIQLSTTLYLEPESALMDPH